MTREELKEILKSLEADGLRPQLCDTPVPVSSVEVPCGLPTELGDEFLEDYILLPKSLVGRTVDIVVHVIGDSMIDADLEDGDKVLMRASKVAKDNDMVVAEINGGCTIKYLMTDEDGRKWLVPKNDKYDAIELTSEGRIVGVVEDVVKSAVRASTRDLLTSVRRTKSKMRQATKLSEEEVNERIVNIGEEVKHARQWFAVMRALVDYEVIPTGSYDTFCARVCRLLPEHDHLPTPKEIARMDVLSFARPVPLWREDNAPVSGSRFRDYKSIALLMISYLGEKG